MIVKQKWDEWGRINFEAEVEIKNNAPNQSTFYVHRYSCTAFSTRMHYRVERILNCMAARYGCNGFDYEYDSVARPYRV